MKFSIIIATKNAAPYLRRCLNSVLSQEYGIYEIIIQDCASQDGTSEILEEFKGRIDLRSEKDSGVYDAWNRALARASGDWAIFLGADDCFAACDVLMQARAYLARMPEYTDFAYGALLTGRNAQIRTMIDRTEAEVYRIFLSSIGFPFPATFSRLAALKKYAFDARYRIAGDFDMAARAVRSDNIARLPLAVSYMEEGGLSTNKKFRRLLLAERSRVIRTHILPKAAMLLQTHLEYLRMEGAAAPHDTP
ncbi:MAG: glycosyltransferase [Desulfovibrio sp.]|jgi:GT2 family glycosyltransferase|nr:glycosyltransferase [Desulfovibrio sp.]